ncbi:MAG TPA: hypothetical protein VEN29_21915 [Casimicrobiaceae bacterium]|nr:hypothetical protein [Casimicrobiaceae bacterium]
MRSTPIIVTAVLVSFFAFLFVHASSAPRPLSSPAPLDTARHLAAEEAKIRQMLIDPESARFRNDFVSRKDGEPVVCGEINYKNSLGGYIGYQRFIWGRDVQLFGIETDADEMARQWEARCATMSCDASGGR